MLLQSQPPVHLTYCLNVHPGESWDEQFRAIRDDASRVRQAVAPGRPFGLGLRLGSDAAIELEREESLASFREWLAGNGMYVATVNGFPFGRFHDARVKEQVYAPDWRTPERRDYTIRLARILAALLPPGAAASISTVPGSFRDWIRSDADADAMALRLVECAAELARIDREHGRCIQLAMEPEPGCWLERADDVIKFIKERLFRAGPEALLRRHVGVCLDTCHAAVMFESPETLLRTFAAEGIGVFKVQLSAALAARNSAEARAELAAFAEPTYLHQAAAQAGAFWIDLPQALADLEQRPDGEEVRVHFHVPLFWEGGGALGSTASTLTPAFFEALRGGASPVLEIETYTFHVLPAACHPEDLVGSLIREFEWVIENGGWGDAQTE
jgi:sugar phosphate isomerase/epimerase